MTDLPIVLASQSPRRQELLDALQLDYLKTSVDVEENIPQDVSAQEAAVYLARKKGQAAIEKYDQHVVITADTVVILDDQILGKPAHQAEAHKMLESLSGRSHQVMTGVYVATPDEQTRFSDTTLVKFRELRKDEISFYTEHYQPFDKAGGYAIQEWLGKIAVTTIEGSFYNVVGLPVHRLYETLRTMNVLSGG